jgi:hypothetical protein
MPTDANPLDPETHYRVVTFDGSQGVSGYKLGEPCKIECGYRFCGAFMWLTERKTPSIWEQNHAPGCPNGDETTMDDVPDEPAALRAVE